MKDVGGAVFAGSTPPFLGRERAAVDVEVVGPGIAANPLLACRFQFSPE